MRAGFPGPHSPRRQVFAPRRQDLVLRVTRQREKLIYTRIALGAPIARCSEYEAGVAAIA
jgi:hypothetical protein